MSSYGSFARVYDRLTDNIEYKKRADYICTLFEHYGVKNNATVLDLACGTGSILIELAKRGYEMIGVDLSTEMLDCAREKTADTDLDVLLICQDMAELDLFGTIDAAVCTLDSLNHLDSADDVKSAIEKVGLFMNHGGIFIFDMNTLYKHREILGNNTFVYDCDDVYCVWQNYLNDDDSIDICLDIFESDGEAYCRSGEEFSERAYPIKDVELWLSNADFELIKIYDEMSFDDICDKTERAVFVAKYIGKAEECNNG